MNQPGGIIAATLTPVTANWQPDVPKACAYYAGLLENGCDGLNVLGTTGEAMSFSIEQRLAFMRGLEKGGLPLERMMAGTGSASLADTVALTKGAIEAGFGGMLVMPPFFYRPGAEDGVLRFFEALLKQTNPGAGRIYLYNFPQMSGTTFTVGLVRRILNIVPLAGVKDSSSDLAYDAELHRAFPDLAIFPSSESHLVFAKNAGLAGCISGTVALWPQVAGALWKCATDATAAPQQVKVSTMRDIVASHPLIPAVRFLTAHRENDSTWMNPVPPLEALGEQASAELTLF